MYALPTLKKAVLKTIRFLTRSKNMPPKKTPSSLLFCAKIEAEISDLLEEDKLVFLEDLGMHEPGLDRVIRAAYQLTRLANLFSPPVKKKSELGQFIKGDLAPQAAGVIHTDFERGFIPCSNHQL